ncbi:cytochrome P450 6B7 [Culex quinquefasciatus]|uniref:Cytochrome P450 6B7 n=1 Tax=Culex quinquefasciatus TaxID=7176 RepID=B0VZI7_CULQU|nr:probable cytochrome P450 308a1 [Culex quinquefasciatus]EDS31724.1 cytochrome P450 6B7 [Culex quinquefasciatus]|eukprot:XP_001841871.1 cytochrome P450 6B7 [Culex quinquefasciatus]
MIELYVALGVLAVCLYFKWSCSHWRRVGNVDGPSPLPLFGNTLEQVLGTKHFGEIFDEVYKSYPSAAWVGIYQMFNKPSIVVRDLELVKDILVGDFASFNKNAFEVDEKVDPLIAMNPFVQAGEKWKERRAALIPLFSASKIRTVFPIIKNVAENLLQHVTDSRGASPDFEAKEMCGRFTVDSVSSSAFGIDAESITNPDGEVARNCFEFFNPNSTASFVRSLLLNFCPKVAAALNIGFVPGHVARWIHGMVGEVLRQRQSGEVKRQDMFQALYESLSQNDQPVRGDEIAGHSLTFLSEGFETSSTLMSYLLYELASNQDIQERVLNELDFLLKDSNGQLTDEVVQKLSYLELTMYETLRLHSPVFALSKVCVKEYELPPQYGTGNKRVRIAPGTVAIIPVYGIHLDPEIYPDPYKFNPDRFLEENKKARHRYAFLSFGEGPRICLGMKFGLLQSKIGIATLLSKYRVELSPKQELPLEFSKTCFLLAPKNGIWVRFVERR